MKDLVSIIMPSYNTASFLQETLDSVLAQTYPHWELLVVDDASTDNTDEVMARQSDSRIRYLKNETNSGAALTRNYALREARGKWIAFLDSDDLWLPDKLEKQIAFMEKGGYHFSYTDYEEMDESSALLGRLVTGPDKIGKRGMYRYCWPGCLTVMYDAGAVGLVQIADIKKNNDYAMWLKVCRKAVCYRLPESLARYRKRSGSISHHSYRSLIRWHYALFREAEGCGRVSSFFHTLQNLFFGVWKKLFYVKKKNAEPTGGSVSKENPGQGT